MNIVLGGVGTCMAFFGIFMNLYVIIVLLLNKKARTSSEWILLHLSWCGLGASFFNLCLISPSIFMSRWFTSTGSLCSVVGAAVLTIQILTVWSICALSADRCAAIASPLRYTQLVTGRRVAIFFLIIWVLSIGTAMAAYIVSAVKTENIANARDNNRLSTINGNSGINVNVSAPTVVDGITTTESKENDVKTIFSSAPSSSSPDFLSYSSTNFKSNREPIFSSTSSVSIPVKSTTDAEFNTGPSQPFSSPTVANMIFELEKSAIAMEEEESEFKGEINGDITSPDNNYNPSHVTHQNVKSKNYNSNDNNKNDPVENESVGSILIPEFRETMGLCLPRVYYTSLPSVLWITEWIIVVLLAPLSTILACDLVVLSIARKQRHRIVMALYQITLSAQATVVRSKGATPPQLWLNRSIPARSRACRAVLEDLSSIVLIHGPLILILVFEMLVSDHHAPVLIHYVGSISLFVSPSFTALLYGIRARSLRAAYKSYIRKRMTNNTLQHEIQQRLSPVDGGSPRPSSGAKSFRSCTPSPASSPIATPRRLSTNDLRPPPMHFPMSNSPLLQFPSANALNTAHHNSRGTTTVINNNPEQNNVGNHNACHGNNYSNDNGLLGMFGGKPRKIRSFLNLPTQYDMQEFWSGLRRPNRSPTIIITHEIRLKDSANSSYDSKSIVSSPTAEQRL